MNLHITKEWFENRVAFEGDLEISAGLREEAVACEECDQLTHVDEAACLHCGALKDWAKD
ncbi:MAG: hypothetical protein K5905_22830 [Roseibium sp.]|uniref:hypothetical protein n=1 Tax=Roseibium sp. TaxID=1936156 RepID=UPI0026271B60|nr:hypothetical protein [Roseibium sp.]MCV0428302.1 hypothetical protein [Roseibium sp.]